MVTVLACHSYSRDRPLSAISYGEIVLSWLDLNCRGWRELRKFTTKLPNRPAMTGNIVVYN